ncbi:MAG: exopolysaccharide biosynthesis polyprenyl glycosylphosphotransferase [Actinomycetia bacterium]|nr:exopolysaccharide biosynthesis polyprenyl glycosylphosphotransferase [Actinomycetes bacterium]
MTVVSSRVRPEAEPVVAGRPDRPSDWTDWYARSALIVDFLSALTGGMLAFFLRFPESPESADPYVVGSMSLPVVWILALVVYRAYEPRFFGVGWEEFRRILNAGFTVTALVAIVAYASKVEVARGYVVMALPLATVLNLAARYRLRKWLHRLRGRGRCMRRVVAVGHPAAAGDLIRLLRTKRYHGMDIVGVCLPTLPKGDLAGLEVDGVPVLGDFSEVAMTVEAVGADSVAVLACPELDGAALRRLAWQIEKNDVELIVAPALMDVAGPRISIRPVAGLPLLHVDHPELTGGRQLVKTLFDRVGALTVLMGLTPLLAVVAVAIKITSSGPVLFRQVRVGRDGREFMVLKFRTMVQDAEARKADLLERNEQDGALFKIKQDPRVTPWVGGWLRRYSLDELPQLINVMRGEMSLVGPRPPLPEEVAQYRDDVRRRLVVRPGLTGLWQVNGRSDLTWEESVRLDLRYVENWSLMMDLLILWKTLAAVLSGDGAY